MSNRDLFQKIITVALWVLLFGLMAYWLSICTACTTIDTSKSFWGDPSWIEPHDGMDNGNPASINPKIVVERRCFKTFKADEEFMERVKKRWPGKRIEWIEAANDGLLWKRGDIYEAIIYLEKEGNGSKI